MLFVPKLSLPLCLLLVTVHAFAQQEQPDAVATRKQVDEFLKENPTVVRDIQTQTIARENLEWMFRIGAATREAGKSDARGDDVSRARAERAVKAAIQVMTEAEKLNLQQAKELYDIVFPKELDWDARYEAFLKEVPGVAKAVESGRITKEKVIAGIKSREGQE